MSLFKEMGLPKALLTRLANMGLVDPTPIQAHAIPVALQGQDVMGLAQTGTGKTAAFGVPMIARMMEFEGKPNPKSVRGLILAPTRELAKQISDTIRELVKGSPMKVGLVVGGASINAQIQRIARGTDVLVATPGRLIDLMERRAINLSETKFLVLDEADQMLDLGFIHALRTISQALPSERQTMVFSATMPKQMNEIANSYLQSPKRIEVNPAGKAADKIEQSVHFIAKAEKSFYLVEQLEKHRDQQSIVFCRTKHGASKLAKFLQGKGFKVDDIHGNKSQGQRTRAISAMQSGEIMVLVATDVAARGLDIPAVRYVYNYELPNVPENYVHRIGRTARAGAEGFAIAFCSPEEMGELIAVQKVMKTTIPVGYGRPWENTAPQEGKKTSGRSSGKPRGRSGGGNRSGGSGGGAPRTVEGRNSGPTGAQKARQRKRAKPNRSAA